MKISFEFDDLKRNENDLNISYPNETKKKEGKWQLEKEYFS